MSVVKKSMERVTITLPPELLERIDEDRGRAGGKRSTFIVKVLASYYRRKDKEEKDEIREALIEVLKSPEWQAVLRETLTGQEAEEEGAAAGEEAAGEEEPRVVLPRRTPPKKEAEADDFSLPRLIKRRKPRGDSIEITAEMRSLMFKFQNNPDRPYRSELRRDYGIDISDLRRWISGEKPRMRKETWERLKPVLERYAST